MGRHESTRKLSVSCRTCRVLCCNQHASPVLGPSTHAQPGLGGPHRCKQTPSHQPQPTSCYTHQHTAAGEFSCQMAGIVCTQGSLPPSPTPTSESPTLSLTFLSVDCASQQRLQWRVVWRLNGQPQSGLEQAHISDLSPSYVPDFECVSMKYIRRGVHMHVWWDVSGSSVRCRYMLAVLVEVLRLLRACSVLPTSMQANVCADMERVCVAACISCQCRASAGVWRLITRITSCAGVCDSRKQARPAVPFTPGPWHICTHPSPMPSPHLLVSPLPAAPAVWRLCRVR